MEKNKTLKIVGLIIGLLVIVGVAVYFIGNKKEEKKDNTNISEKSDNTSQKTNVKSDFWLGNVTIPSKTKEAPNSLIAGFESVPLDLKKIDGSYTFNYIDYPSFGDPVNYKVTNITDIKGNLWDSGNKLITIKNGLDEEITSIGVHSECKSEKYTTYEEAIANNCWSIGINEDKLFNKTFDRKSVDGVSELVQNIFDLLGKPSHIYIRDDNKLTMDDDGIGQLSSDIVYDYGSFKLKFYLLDTYNKKHDFRTLKYYGLSYHTNESFEESLTKDIINELVK